MDIEVICREKGCFWNSGRFGRGVLAGICMCTDIKISFSLDKSPNCGTYITTKEGRKKFKEAGEPR
jgi:hypothetical protein